MNSALPQRVPRPRSSPTPCSAVWTPRYPPTSGDDTFTAIYTDIAFGPHIATAGNSGTDTLRVFVTDPARIARLKR